MEVNAKPEPNDDKTSFASILNFISADTRVFALTGAGCSTRSGLGDYRDQSGQWKRAQPITGQTFRHDQAARHRYWARSAVGWPAFNHAQPNASHVALRQLQTQGVMQSLITQNVDRLHQKAGHENVIDLHGVLATVSCLDCHSQLSRNEFQSKLISANPWLSELSASFAPDGDADLDADNKVQQLLAAMRVPFCEQCGGLIKPDVVFFGENVPKPRVEKAMDALRNNDVLLVAGSSLMVFSGYRFCRDAAQRDQPIIIVNKGVTRADELASVKLNADCGDVLTWLSTNVKTQT